MYLDGSRAPTCRPTGASPTAMVFLVFVYWLAAMFLFGGEINGTVIAARRRRLQAQAQRRREHREADVAGRSQLQAWNGGFTPLSAWLPTIATFQRTGSCRGVGGGRCASAGRGCARPASSGCRRARTGCWTPQAPPRWSAPWIRPPRVGPPPRSRRRGGDRRVDGEAGPGRAAPRRRAGGSSGRRRRGSCRVVRGPLLPAVDPGPGLLAHERDGVVEGSPPDSASIAAWMIWKMAPSTRGAS